jgi:hypothetical protein
MWDFSFTRSIGAVLRTLPFVILRLIVYLGIAFAYLFSVGVGAFVGYGFGHIGSSPDATTSGAFWGGAIGFGVVSSVLYFAREYILYLVKAAHIAVLVEVLDGKDIPNGQSQVKYGATFVQTHFGEASVLFGVDQIIKGVIRAIFGIINFISAFLPIPALQQMIRIVEAIIRMSLTYVDEVILAYMIRTRTTNPWDTAKDGLVLYAQNYKHILKNAIWLSVFLWGLTFILFVSLLAPAAALLAFVPGHAGLGMWVFAIALVFAWSIKAAVLEPLAIASLMQVYFKVIEGQRPDPEWDARLSQASKKFRDLADKAGKWVHGPAVPQAGAAH